MPRKLLAFCLIISATAQAFDPSETEKASQLQDWLRLYQYEKTNQGHFKSKITAEPFFFAKTGRIDPYAELEAAITAYMSPEKKFGIQKQSAACVFPARKEVLEKLLSTKFPDPPCPDLKTWLERINADRVSLVFVGAYPGNPASILGHTFLRLSNSERENSNREGIDLLSYSVGFMAQPDPRDNKLIYMLKGITGGYDGFYEIEPHYMKVGLYSNSESRDLWDVRLNLSGAEVKLLVKHYWELTFNAKIPYYFIDENCSYRLLTLLEAVRPTITLSKKLSTVVLPAETVRLVIDAGLADPSVYFRSSIKRRVEYKLAQLDTDTRHDFYLARNNLTATENLSDPTALDALLDYWLFQNYKVKTQLNEKQMALMDATYQQAAKIPSDHKFKSTNNNEIKAKYHLTPPFSGHKPHWVEMEIGAKDQFTYGSLRYRHGVHPFWSSDSGYNEISAIEYFGADLEAREQDKAHWNLILVDAKSINHFADWDQRLSWSFSAKMSNDCALCQTDHPQVQAAGGGGLAIKTSNFAQYVLAHLQMAGWDQGGTQGLLAPGALVGSRFIYKSFCFTAQISKHWWKKLDELAGEIRFDYTTNANQNYFIRSQYLNLKSLREELALTIGTAIFF